MLLKSRNRIEVKETEARVVLVGGREVFENKHAGDKFLSKEEKFTSKQTFLC